MTTEEPKPDGGAEPSIEDLIEQSSLGTPGAKALRARTPKAVVDEILRRIETDER